MSASLVQGKQLLELFSGASREEAQNLIESGDLVRMMFEADLSRIDRETFRQLMAASPLVLPPVSLEEQLAKYRRWNEPHSLEITEEMFAAIDLTPTPNLKFGEVDLIVYYAPDKDDVSGVQRTFDVSSQLMAEEQEALFDDDEEHAWKWPGLQSDPEHLRLTAGIERKPGLRRVILDRNAWHKPQQGRSVKEVRTWAAQDGHILAGPEVLWDAALDPQSAQNMDGSKNPFRDMAAYEVTVPDGGPWGSCPYLCRDGRQVRLSAGWVGISFQRWSAPLVREL